MRRRVAAVAVVAVAAAACGGGSSTADTRAAQARKLARSAGLSADVADVLATAARSAAATYTVTYDVEGPAPQTVTVTSRPPERRFDVTAPENGRLVTRSLFATKEGTASCQKGTDRWFCAKTSATPPELTAFTQTATARAIENLRALGRDFTYAVTTRRLLGVDARCLVTTARKGGTTADLCVAPDGTPLLVQRPTGNLRATAYSTHVDRHALDLPAPLDG